MIVAGLGEVKLNQQPPHSLPRAPSSATFRHLLTWRPSLFLPTRRGEHEVAYATWNWTYFWRPTLFPLPQSTSRTQFLSSSPLPLLAVHIDCLHCACTFLLPLQSTNQSLVLFTPTSQSLQTAKMRPWIPLTLAFSAAVAFAQNNKINIPAGASTLNVVAGQVTTITWSDPSSSTVTIKLQQAPITPTSGYVLACTLESPFPPLSTT
jgi:hypothetical protein